MLLSLASRNVFGCIETSEATGQQELSIVPIETPTKFISSPTFSQTQPGKTFRSINADSIVQNLWSIYVIRNRDQRYF